jgi:hypothetical protein
MFWTDKDSNNLESIARSLEKLTEREMERDLIGKSENRSFMDVIKNLPAPNKREVGVYEQNLEETVEQENERILASARTKIDTADREGRTSFFEEQVLDAEELELT